MLGSMPNALTGESSSTPFPDDLRRFGVGVYTDGETEGKEIVWQLTYIVG